MSRWLVSLPVWGEQYVEECCAVVLPALDRAIRALEASGVEDVRIIAHTDQPDRLLAASGSNIECYALPAGVRYFDCMSQAHREVLNTGLRGDVVVPLTAGAVVSEQALVHCAGVFTNPRLHVVLCAVPRVLAEGVLPDTADARDLMHWAWNHRHPITRESTWPSGRLRDLSRTHFELAKSVVTRVCLPHPLAIRIDGRPLSFTPTVDANLIQRFDRSEMHMVQDCRRLAVIKLSSADKGYDLAADTMAERLAKYELVIADPLQRWLLDHPVTLVGPAQDCGDVDFVEKIMKVSGGRP